LKHETNQHKINNPRQGYQRSTERNPQTKVHEEHAAKENLLASNQEQHGTGPEKTRSGKDFSEWYSINLQGFDMATAA
jgi:hypothetical protein